MDTKHIILNNNKNDNNDKRCVLVDSLSSYFFFLASFINLDIFIDAVIESFCSVLLLSNIKVGNRNCCIINNLFLSHPPFV